MILFIFIFRVFNGGPPDPTDYGRDVCIENYRIFCYLHMIKYVLINIEG